MLATVVGAEVRRVVVDEFDIGGQTDTRIRTFDQVVTQQGIAREAAVEHGMKSGNLIDALAGKHAFAVEVLVGV